MAQDFDASMLGVVISDEVRALLSRAMIERLLAQREHTVLNCVVCGGGVPPEAPDAMSVILRFDVAGALVAQYAHGVRALSC
jgi:hypothetical protein